MDNFYYPCLSTDIHKRPQMSINVHKRPRMSKKSLITYLLFALGGGCEETKPSFHEHAGVG